MYASASSRENAELRRQAEGADAVNDAEVHGLGVRAALRGVTISGGTPSTSAAVRVWMSSPLRKASRARVLRHVGQQAQLDLRIVAPPSASSRPRHERRADLAAQLRPDRNVLQVGVEEESRPVAAPA